MASISGLARSVGQRFRSGEGRDETEGDAEPAPRNEPQTTLFRCPECESVYVATAKDACSTCDTAVAEIPSTLTETA